MSWLFYTKDGILKSGENLSYIYATGPQGIQGRVGDMPIITIGSTTTSLPGTSASVSNSGTYSTPILDFVVPRGTQIISTATPLSNAEGGTGDYYINTVTRDVYGPKSGGVWSATPASLTGPQGSSGTITVGTVSATPYGSTPAVTNRGTSTNAIFDFVLPAGPAATISVGTVTSTPAGGPTSVTNSGTTSAAVFNFVIPAGAGVAAGGSIDQILTKKSATNYDTEWRTYLSFAGYATPIGESFKGYATPVGQIFNGYATPTGQIQTGQIADRAVTPGKLATPFLGYATPVGNVGTGTTNGAFVMFLS